MDNTRRRAYIKEKLEQAEHRLRGADLANECGVSRQVIVGDMALLRAEGMDIISTPRGYYLNKEKKGCLRTLVCRHGRQGTEKELIAIVAAGGIIHDVRVEHEIYGELHGQLEIKSKEDAVSFVRDAGHRISSPLGYQRRHPYPSHRDKDGRRDGAGDSCAEGNRHTV